MIKLIIKLYGATIKGQKWKQDQIVNCTNKKAKKRLNSYFYYVFSLSLICKNIKFLSNFLITHTLLNFLFFKYKLHNLVALKYFLESLKCWFSFLLIYRVKWFFIDNLLKTICLVFFFWFHFKLEKVFFLLN